MNFYPLLIRLVRAMHVDNNDIRLLHHAAAADKQKEALNVSEEGEAKAEAVRSLL